MYQKTLVHKHTYAHETLRDSETITESQKQGIWVPMLFQLGRPDLHNKQHGFVFLHCHFPICCLSHSKYFSSLVATLPRILR